MVNELIDPDRNLNVVEKFEISSGKICITDPCYQKDTWCSAWNLKARNGVWVCQTIRGNCGSWGNRIKEIICVSEDDFPIGELSLLIWTKLPYGISVDSGQCGIFDFEKYPDEKPNYSIEGSFYRKCCDLTLGDKWWGVIDFGCVTSSGYGDGGYTAYAVYDDDKETIIGVRIVFIDDSIDEEYDDNEDITYLEDE